MAATRTVFIDTALSNYQSLATQYDAGIFNVVLLNNASPHAEQIQGWMASAGVSAASIDIVSTSASVNGAFTPRVVFVDAGVADLNTVIAGVPANATVVVLDAARDGIQQIKDYLAANAGKVGAIDIVTDLASVDVVSHGAPGEVTLGSTVLNASNLASYSAQLADIGSHLSAGGDILLYGCDVASGTAGQQFITALASATGADVAASTDLTGSAAAGGDWVLEASTGTIETAALNIPNYDALLAVTSMGSYTLLQSTTNSGTLYTRANIQTIGGSFADGSSSAPDLYYSMDNGTTKNQITNITFDKKNGTGNFSISGLDLGADGVKTIRFYDHQGSNYNPITGGVLTVTLDTHLTAPTVALTSDTGVAGDRVTNNAALTFNTSDSDASRTFKVDTSNPAPSYNPASLGEGPHTVVVTDTDAAGNTKSASITFTLDRTAPVVTATLANDTGSSNTDGKTKDASLNLSTLESGATRSYSVDGKTATSSYDPSSLSEGPHTVQVFDTDLAGNIGSSSVVSFTLDKTAPVVTASLANDTGSSNTDGKTKDASLNLSALESGATRSYSIDGKTATSSYDPSSLSEGPHTVQVFDTDLAGNMGSSLVVSFTLDKTAPVVTATLANDTGSSNTDGKTKDASLTLSALESGATRSYSVDGKTATGSYDPTALSDGPHTVQVFDSDLAGNIGSSSVVSFSLDKTAPVVTASLANDTGSSNTDGKTKDASLNLSALESGATRSYSIDGKAATSSYDPSALSEGPHTVQVFDTDLAGNIGSSSVVSFTLDKTAPVVTASLANDTGSSNTDGKTKDASLNLSALESGATRSYSIDGKAATSSYDPTALSEGPHTVQVFDTDLAGNIGSSSVVSFTLDRTAPVVTATLANDTGSSQTDGITRDASLTLSGLESGATRSYSVDGKAATSSYDAAALTEGQHTVQVTDTDLAGNVGQSTLLTFTLDKTAPTVTATLTSDTGSSNSDGITKDASLTLSTLEKDATRSYSIDGKAATSSYDAATLSEGEHTVQVIDTDLAGNVGNSSVVSFTFDKTAPAVTATLANDTGSSQTDGITKDASLTLSGLESSATRSYSVDGKAATSSYDAAALTEGQHTVQVTDTDLAGNVGQSTLLTFILDKTAPTVTATLANDTGSSQTDGITRDASLTLSAPEKDATRSYSIDGKAAISSYDAATLSEGEHTVQVIDTDLAGNVGQSKSLTFTLDKTAPVVTAELANDTGSSKTDGITSDAALSLSLLESGATRSYSVDGKAATSSYDAAALTEGQHTVQVTDTDLAGNVGQSTLLTFILDKTVPVVTASLANDTGSSQTDGITRDASLTLSTPEKDATRSYSIDGKAAISSYDAATLSEGEHTVQVIDTDLAGNIGQSTLLSFTLDKTAPVVTAALANDTGISNSDGITKDASVALSTLEKDATRSYSVDGKAATSSYDAAALTEGQHTVQVTDTDLAGNVGQSTLLTFILDKTAPTVTATLTNDTGSSQTDGITRDASLTLSTLEKDATRSYSIDGNAATSSYDAATLSEGKHTVQVIDTDLAGNVGTSSAVTFTLDKTAPVVTASLANDTGSSQTDRITKDASLNLSALESGATRSYSVDGKAATSSYDAAALTEGQHTVQVTDTDLAGNVGQSTSLTFTLDKTAPTVTATLANDTGSSNSDGITKDASLTLSTLEKDATRSYSIDGKAATSSYDAATLSEGEHTVQVIDTDLAGNVGNSSVVSFTFDKTAPAVTATLANDTGSSQTDGITKDASLTLSTLESGATRSYSVDGKAPSSSYDAAALTEGQHTVQVTDTDLAGNVGQSTLLTFILDKTVPVVTASLANDTGSSQTDGITRDASLTLSTLEKDATRSYSIDGNAATSSYDAATLSEGEHTIQVIDTDLAGNVGQSKSLTFTLDKTAPVVTASLANDTGSSNSDGITKDASLTLSTLESGATRSYSVDGKAPSSSYDAAALTEGQHTVQVTDTDLAGNVGQSTLLTFTLDKTAPTVTATLTNDTGSSNSDGITKDASLTLSTLEKDATRSYSIDGKAATSSYDAATLSEGEHTVQVIDTDLAGNVGQSKSLTFTLDKTAPVVTAALANDTGSSNSDGITKDASLALSTLEKDATRSYSVDGKAVTSSYDAAALTEGQHTVQVTDTDLAGNVGQSTLLTFILDKTAPTVTATLANDTGSSQTDGITRDASLTLSTLEKDATRSYSIDGKAATSSYDAATLSEGEHTVQVIDTDLAGNVGQSKLLTFTLDKTAPVVTAALANDTGSSNSDGITKDASLALSTLESGATRSYSVDGKAATSSYDAAALTEGQHTVQVTDTDLAGNVGQSTLLTFILDKTAPTVTASLANDTGSSQTDGITRDASLTLSTLEKDATRSYSIDGKAATSSYDAATLSEGKHTVQVIDTDLAGNVGTSSAVTFTLDKTAPVVTASLANDTGSSQTDRITKDASLNLSALESGATRTYSVDGKAATSSYDAAALTEGQHTVQVTDTDLAGNVGQSTLLTFILDKTAPTVTATLTNDTGSSNSDGITKDASLTLSTPEKDATRSYSIDGKPATNSYDPKALADGHHTVEVTDTDLAGNSKTAKADFTLDTTLNAPTARLTSDSGAAGDGLTNNAGLTFNTADSDATRVIKVDGTAVGGYDASKLAEGKHTVVVTDTDGAGNTGSTTVSFELDSKGPVFSSAASASVAENIGANQLVYKAIAADPHGVTYSLAGTDAARFDIATDGSVTLKDNPNYESVNAYAFTVVATDGAGNHTDQAVVLGITNVNEAPVATGVSKSTIENAPISFQLADNVTDVDAGDTMAFSLGSSTATLSWANTDAAATTSLINPVTKTAVDIATLSVKASLAPDGTVTLTPPAELDWMMTGQALKATFSYTVTDAGGLKSQESISFVMNGSTNDKGVTLSGGNGDDSLAGNASNNAEDVLTGNNGNDTLNGYGGTDALYGGNGNDKLYGGAGIDYLYGDNGDDLLDGGSEGDFLFGGKGNDLLTGGTGADKFVFAPQNGNDRITDFHASEGDMLYFADFFTTKMDEATFLSKYVTDIGNDLQINLQGTTIVLAGVPNVADLAGHIAFAMPA